MIDRGIWKEPDLNIDYSDGEKLFLDGGKDGRYNSKGVTAHLYGGDVTTVDIKRIMSNFKYGEKGETCKVAMTGG